MVSIKSPCRSQSLVKLGAYFHYSLAIVCCKLLLPFIMWNTYNVTNARVYELIDASSKSALLLICPQRWLWTLNLKYAGKTIIMISMLNSCKYSRISADGHLSTTATFFVLADTKSIHWHLFKPSLQRPLSSVPKVVAFAEWFDCIPESTPVYMKTCPYRAFSHDVTPAIWLYQSNKAAAMLVFQTNPFGVEPFPM